MGRIVRSLLLIAVAGSFLTLCIPAGADVILVPDRIAKVVWVLDPTSGDAVDSFDISSFAEAPTEIIDGPGSTLLISDQVANEVFRLNSHGDPLGVHLTEKVDSIRGIYLMPNGTLIGATSHAIRAWDASGIPLKIWHKGDFYDVVAVMPSVLATCAVDDENIKGYSSENGMLLGETPLGQLRFPQQMNLVRTDRGPRLAVCSFEGKSVHLFRRTGSNDTTLSLGQAARGIVQLDSGNLLISTAGGLVEYTVDGAQIRTVMAGNGFWFLNRSRNYESR